MGVTTSNRRERVRRVDGTTVDLAGGAPATGLTAIAAARAGVTSLSGAARAATHAAAMTPYAEATIGFQSTRATAPALDRIANDGAYLYHNAPGTWEQLGQVHAWWNTDARSRRNNAQWSVMRADVHELDDLQSQAGPIDDYAGDDPDVAAPWVMRPPGGFARLIANPEADPAGTAWTLTAADVDENMLDDPGYVSSTRWQSATGSTFQVASGGLNGSVKYQRHDWNAALPGEVAVRTGQVPAAPGGVASFLVVAKGTATLPQVTIDVYATTVRYTGAQLDPAAILVASRTFALTTAWQTFAVENVVNPQAVPGYLVPVIRSVGLANAGAQLHIDSVKGTRAPVAGVWGYGSSPGWVWESGSNASRSVLRGTPTGSALYSRATDAAAPALGLTPVNRVHRRTGVGVTGDRLSSPVGTCKYMVTATPQHATYGRSQARTFTVAGWVKFIAGTSPAGPPLVRWVIETTDGPDGSDFTYSEPFAPSGQVYLRFARTVVLARSGGGTVTTMRVHLEVVEQRGSVAGGSSLSVRGVHVYAGPDRGDTEGLKAVPVTDALRIGYRVTPDATYVGTSGQAVTRVDVHGNDRISHVTSATATVYYAVTPGTTAGQVTSIASGGSPGRLTVRGLEVPAAAVGGAFDIRGEVEETNAGPGGDLALGNLEGWFEEDVTDRIVTLDIDRSTDADPSSSTVPVGNFAASTVDLALDDPDGDLDLFARTYIDSGHRIDTAIGVVYTNRHDDPEGVLAAAAALPSASWPSSAAGASPVVLTAADQYGQRPAAAYCGHAAGSFGPLITTAPAFYGQTVRAQVWLRWSGGPVPPVVSMQPGIASYGIGWAVTTAGTARVATLPVPLEPNRWHLVDLPALTLDAACNVAAITCTPGDSSPDSWLELAAPTFERVVGTDVVEVVETTPGGVFYSTTYGDGTGGAEVQLSGVDILASAGGADLPAAVVASSTVEDYSRDIARRFLDLGEDQVVIVDQDTPLTYVVPASSVSTMLADLAKVASLTAYTDGLGRLTMLLRSETPTDYLTQYLDDRNLIEATSAIAPDQVINDVSVTVHPVQLEAVAVELAYAGRADPVVTGSAWTPAEGEVTVPAGTTFEVWLDRSPAVDLVTVVQWSRPGDPFVTEANGLNYVMWSSTDFGASTKVTIRNDRPDSLSIVLVRATTSGRAMTELDQSIRKTREQSIAAFGRKPSAVDIRLARSTIPAPAVADGVLEAYSLRDPSGERWLPDLNATVLGDPWRELGDRVLVSDTDAGLSGEFRVLSHHYTYGTGADSSLYLRRVPTGLLYLVVDVDRADDGRVASY